MRYSGDNVANRLRVLLTNLQQLLETELTVARGAHAHPVAKGVASEIDWVSVLGAHLPARYSVAGGFVVDSIGQESEQIDVIVFDAQYSALVFNRKNMRYVPAESVYAVFEAKQELNKKHVGYAMSKAASVRRLRRTSVPISHAGGTFAPKRLFPIIAGILTLESAWSPPFGKSFAKAVAAVDKGTRLDLGCAVKHGAFELDFANGATPSVSSSGSKLSLATFLLTFLARLQDAGTVPAMDYRAYLRGVSRT
ncbi:MAG TPA: DUF6602 domain-containing protein [Polyangiaceae bacterium]|nr:DUF6602 domain-containing protein [Polyangiaceae bacterium]